MQISERICNFQAQRVLLCAFLMTKNYKIVDSRRKNKFTEFYFNVHLNLYEKTRIHKCFALGNWYKANFIVIIIVLIFLFQNN